MTLSFLIFVISLCLPLYFPTPFPPPTPRFFFIVTIANNVCIVACPSVFLFWPHWGRSIYIRGQFHQRSMYSFYIRKLHPQLFCAYVLGLYFTGARLLAQKLQVERWWNPSQGWATIFVCGPYYGFISVSRATFQSKRLISSQNIALRGPDVALRAVCCPLLMVIWTTGNLC